MNIDFDKVALLIGYLKGGLSRRDKRKAGAMIKSDKDTKELYPVVRELYLNGQGTNWNQVQQAAFKLSARLFKDFLKSRKKRGPAYGITVFDSGILPLPEGVRPATVDTRRVKYRVGDMFLEVSLYPVSIGSYEIIGQISGMEGEAALEVVLKSAGTTFAADTDQFNVFRFPRIPVGKYFLYLVSGNKKIGSVTVEL